jgi:hypothetical protein
VEGAGHCYPLTKIVTPFFNKNGALTTYFLLEIGNYIPTVQFAGDLGGSREKNNIIANHFK